MALEDTTVTTLEDEEPEWLRSLKEKVPQSPDCGVEADDRVYGGKEADFRQFSWMVLLQFLKRKMRVMQSLNNSTSFTIFSWQSDGISLWRQSNK